MINIRFYFIVREILKFRNKIKKFDYMSLKEKYNIKKELKKN